MLVASNITMQFGAKPLFENVSIKFGNGHRYGLIGANGCGKSNLLEALRWVMGETSHKSMRAAAMDDVIFAGAGSRPMRNNAEVTLFIDNTDRSAPAPYNDFDAVEITRRIEEADPRRAG